MVKILHLFCARLKRRKGTLTTGVMKTVQVTTKSIMPDKPERAPASHPGTYNKVKVFD